nr:protein DMP8-like [Ipomoea batatas]
MDPTTEGFGVKIYEVSPRQPNLSKYPSTPASVSAVSDLAPPPGGGRRKRAMANGVQKTLSKTSLLANFLPTGTLLSFEMVLPSVYGKGDCSGVSATMIVVLLALCALSCFFFHFTDSFRGPDGKVFYGFVTPAGLAVFKSDPGVEIPKDERYKVGVTDLVHALMSVLVFVAIAFSDHRVTDCLFPGHAKELYELAVPLGIGVAFDSRRVSDSALHGVLDAAQAVEAPVRVDSGGLKNLQEINSALQNEDPLPLGHARVGQLCCILLIKSET